MLKKPSKSQIPNPPKAIGLSRRLMICIGLLVFLVMALFLIFLKHYTPHPNTTRVVKTNTVSDSESSEAMIAKIKHQEHHPTLVNFPEKMADMPYSVAPLNPLTQSDFKQGGDASISVYHNTISPVQNNTSSSGQGSASLRNPLPGGSNQPRDPYALQNMQSEKTAFLKSSAASSKAYIRSKLQQSLNPYEIKAGTIIPATLMTGINSSLPGTIVAKVRRDVFDTISGNYLLIPQGTTLIGNYDSQVAYGQSRVLIAWSRLIFPNGSSFDLNGMPGADLAGMAGLHDQVNNHYFRIFGSALMFSVFGALGQLSQPTNTSNQLTTQQIIYGAIGQQMSQTASQLMAKNMNIQPTLKIRPGTNFNVLLTRDMVLPKPYGFDR